MSTDNRRVMASGRQSDDAFYLKSLLKLGVALLIKMAVDGSISFSKWESDLSETLGQTDVGTADLYLESVLLANWIFKNQEVVDDNDQFEQICSQADVIRLSGSMDEADIKKLYKAFIELGMRDLARTTAEVQHIVKVVRPDITADQVRDMFIAGSPTTNSVEVAKLAYNAARKNADALLDAARTRCVIASERMEMALCQASSSEATTLEYDAVMEAKRDYDEAAAAVNAVINGPAYASIRDAQKAYLDAIKES